MKVLSLAVACTALMMIAGPASAAIIAVNPQGTAIVNGGGAGSQTFSYDATGAEKLVVTFASEGNQAASTDPDEFIPAITFNGVPLNEAVIARDPTNLQVTGVFYLDNPFQGSADIVIDWGDDEVNGAGIGAVGLIDAVTGGPVAVGSNDSGLTVGLTGLPDDSFAIATAVANGGPVIGVDGALTSFGFSSDVGSAEAGAGFQLPVSGDVSYTFTGGGDRPVAAAAAFAAVPEPTGLALLALGMTGVAARRRK